MTDAKEELFANDDKSAASDTDDTTNQEPLSDPFKDLLGGIMNDDGTQKYTDVESALNSITHAQKHISDVESDNAELKDKLIQAEAAQELLRKAMTAQKPDSPADQASMLQAINDVLDLKETAKTKATNLDIVGKVFSDTYGDKAKSELKALADANGVGIEFIKDLSEKAPQAVLKLAGLTTEGAIEFAKTRSTTNIDSLEPTTKDLGEAKSIMGNATTKEMVSAWKLAGERVANRS